MHETNLLVDMASPSSDAQRRAVITALPCHVRASLFAEHSNLRIVTAVYQL